MNPFNMTAMLAKLIDNRRPPSSYLLDTYFAQKHFSDDEYIHFDELPGDLGLAPFVAASLPALAEEIDEGEVKLFRPAYVKPMHQIKNSSAIARALGEAIGGTETANTRYINQFLNLLEVQRNQIIRRKELMAAEVLQTGKAIIEGENYPRRTLDYGRAADQTLVLTGGDRWGQAGVRVLRDLERWSQRATDASGHPIDNVIFGSGAWEIAREDEHFLTILDNRRQASGAVELGPVSAGAENEKSIYLGTIGNLNFYKYVELYKDDAGVMKPMIDPNNVCLVASSMDGIQAQGAIQNPDHGFQPLEFAAGIVEKDNPRVDLLITESAPLVIPGQPDATFCATVHTVE